MINKITITNFLSIASLEVNLSPGLNVISAPTGSGKTNLMSAIGWCLFNAHAFGNQDNLARHGTTFAEAEVEFTIKGRNRCVSRTRVKGKNSFNCEGYFDMPAWVWSIDENIQYPYSRVWDAIYAPALSLPGWKALTLSQAKKHYESVFGLDQYERAWQESARLVSGLRESVARLEGALDTLPEENKENAAELKIKLLETCDKIDALYQEEDEYASIVKGVANEWDIDIEGGYNLSTPGYVIRKLEKRIQGIETHMGWNADRMLFLSNSNGVCPECGQEISLHKAEEISRELIVLERANRDLGASKEAMVNGLNMVIEASNNIIDLEQEVNYLEEFKRKIQSDLDADSAVAEKRKEIVANIELAKEKMGSLVAARYHLRNAPSALSGDIASFVSKVATNLLQDTGLSVAMSSDYEVEVFEDGRSLGSQVSTGQSVLVGLALKLACMEAVRGLGVELPDFIILDEITSGSLDSEMSQVVPQIISKYLAKGYQVIAVDHSGLWDSEAANIIKLSKEDGVTVWA